LSLEETTALLARHCLRLEDVDPAQQGELLR